jgi:hypothetical protein
VWWKVNDTEADLDCRKWRLESVFFKWFCHIDGPVISAEASHFMTHFTFLSKTRRNRYAQSVWKISLISNQPVTLHEYIGIDLNAFVLVHACMHVQ